jgi:hypothetical protein
MVPPSAGCGPPGVVEARAVPFSSHLWPDYSAHVLAATPRRIGWSALTEARTSSPTRSCPCRGFTTPREPRGAGVEWNEPAIVGTIPA